MKLFIKENSKNYACSIVEIKDIFDIEGADNVKRTVIFGNNIVIRNNIKVGDKLLYFVSGTKLSAEYCKFNNLYDKPEENEDVTVKSFISFRQKRVKALKLRGVISDGLLMPLESLGFNSDAWDSSLKVGDEFTDINGISICEKYFVPVKNDSNKKDKTQKTIKINRVVDKQFYLHVDTSNLRKNTDKIKPNDIISLHKKKHGTSFVVSNILTNRVLNWFEKLLIKFGVKLETTEYDIIYSSRKVVKNGYLNTNPNSFYKTDIWGEVAKEIGYKIPKNYTVYGEILGYTSDGSWIQKDYDYGCNKGEHKTYIYRITIVNSDGNIIELTDKQIEEFCEKNDLLYKDTFLYYGKAKDVYPNISIENHWSENFIQQLEKDYNEKDCDMCVNKVPEEGIILRKESSYNYEAYKLKSKRFLLKESEEQEKEITNLEDYQDEC